MPDDEAIDSLGMGPEFSEACFQGQTPPRTKVAQLFLLTESIVGSADIIRYKIVHVRIEMGKFPIKI